MGEREEKWGGGGGVKLKQGEECMHVRFTSRQSPFFRTKIVLYWKEEKEEIPFDFFFPYKNGKCSCGILKKAFL